MPTIILSNYQLCPMPSSIYFSLTLKLISYPFQRMKTYTTTRGDRNLYRIPAGLTHFLQVERLVGGFVVPSFYREGRGVYADLNRRRPVSVHLSVFMVVAFELQFEVGSGKKEENQL